MFNQFFQNPYINHLPPEVRAQLQQQQMFNAGTSLLQNSYGNKGGLAAFGDAMAQFRQGQLGEASQMTEMQRLAEAMKIAQARSQGTDFAADMDRARMAADQARFTRQDETARRGQDIGARVARERGNQFGMFSPDGSAETDEARAARIAAEGANAKPADIEWAQAYWARNPKKQNTAPDDQAAKTVTPTGIPENPQQSAMGAVHKGILPPDIQAKARADIEAKTQGMARVEEMSDLELKDFERQYGHLLSRAEKMRLNKLKGGPGQAPRMNRGYTEAPQGGGF